MSERQEVGFKPSLKDVSKNVRLFARGAASALALSHAPMIIDAALASPAYAESKIDVAATLTDPLDADLTTREAFMQSWLYAKVGSKLPAAYDQSGVGTEQQGDFIIHKTKSMDPKNPNRVKTTLDGIVVEKELRLGGVLRSPVQVFAFDYLRSLGKPIIVDAPELGPNMAKIIFPEDGSGNTLILGGPKSNDWSSGEVTYLQQIKPTQSVSQPKMSEDQAVEAGINPEPQSDLENAPEATDQNAAAQ